MSTTQPWFVLPEKPTVDEPVVVVGAGLAGCHTAFELAQRGVRVLLIDAGSDIASGASGNRLGIVKPFVTRNAVQPAEAPLTRGSVDSNGYSNSSSSSSSSSNGNGNGNGNGKNSDGGNTDKQADLSNQFYQAAFDYLLQKLSNDASLVNQSIFNACGVLQLIDKRFPDSDFYEPCDAQRASELAGVPIHSEALYFARGGYLDSYALCNSIVDHPNITVQLNCRVNRIEQRDKKWTLHLNHNDENNTLKCGTLILSSGEQLNQFTQTSELPITGARGQTSHFNTADSLPTKLRTVVTGKCYAIPQGESVVVGATFRRNSSDKNFSDDDHTQNLNHLQKMLPTLGVMSHANGGFCAVRATTPDRLPLVGPVPDFEAFKHDYNRIKDGLPEHRFPSARYQNNLYVIGGFGSRGIVSAPFCARLLAHHISTFNPSDNDHLAQHNLDDWATLLHPGRFLIRALKRGTTTL